jgi:hypothetical protein
MTTLPSLMILRSAYRMPFCVFKTVIGPIVKLLKKLEFPQLHYKGMFFLFLPLSLFVDYIIVSFCRALKAVRQGRTPGLAGNIPYLTNEELLDVRKQIDENTKRLSPKFNEEVKKMLMAKIKEKYGNTYAREGT